MSDRDNMLRCFRALAANDEGEDAQKARDAILAMGGEGTPEDAKKMLAALGEESKPDRSTLASAIATLRGETYGDRVRASRTLSAAGLDPSRYGAADDARDVNELRERMGTTRSRGIHWVRNDLVFPQMTKEEARRILAARGLTPATSLPPDGWRK